VLEREPTLVCLTITGERTVVALIGVYLVILGLELLELDRDLELERLLEPLEPPLPPPRPPPLAASGNSSNTIVMARRRSTVESRIFVDDDKPSLILFSSLVTCHIYTEVTEECGKT